MKGKKIDVLRLILPALIVTLGLYGSAALGPIALIFAVNTLPLLLVLYQGWIDTAKGVLLLILFFAVAGLITQVFFGQVGTLAKQYPVESDNPFYESYNETKNALNNAMKGLTPVFGIVVALIVISLIWTIVRVFA
ncbi:MAG: hypothetical protein DRJ67_12485 [Thermoprotei archaeon]|nr:MAG: hypothetical protein DRJ67_12485 [Thermoprotei archaeon]